jgi:hypothetical protein
VNSYRYRVELAAWTQWLLAACCLLVAWPAWAQPAKEWKVIEPERVQFPNRMTVLKRGTFDSEAERDLFVRYYTKFAFPRLTEPDFRSRQPWNPASTQTDKSDKGKDVVREIHNDLGMAAAAPAPDVHGKLCEITLAYMGKLAAGADIHPAARFNAMLLLGDVGTPEAVPMLVEVVKDSKQLDAVKVAAMAGLLRHAEQGGISDADLQKLTIDTMVALAVAPLPKDQRADAVCWLRGQAAEVLGRLGSPGRDNSVVAALLKMVGDPALGLSQRCRAARALGQLTYAAPAPAAGPCLEALAVLADDALTAEKQDPPDCRRWTEANVARERWGCRLKANLSDILVGLRGADDQHRGLTELAKPGAEQQLAETLQKTLTPLDDSLNDQKLTRAALIENVTKAQGDLEGVVKRPPK